MSDGTLLDLIARARREAARLQAMTNLAAKAESIPWVFDSTPRLLAVELRALAHDARRERDRLMQEIAALD